jgi:predicted nucleic acid-binding protein
MSEDATRGLLDTNILILQKWIDPKLLPGQSAISVVTLAELSIDPQQAAAAGDLNELARRVEVLQRVEFEFDPIPFDASAARIVGRLAASSIASGRRPRARLADLMIAATAVAEGVPGDTCNPKDFTGLDGVTVVEVPRPSAAP